MPIDTFSLDGSSGGSSGHGVRFDGTVISKGVSIIHLYKVASNNQDKPQKYGASGMKCSSAVIMK